MAAFVALLNWAKTMGWIPSVPTYTPIKTAKLKKMKGRPLTLEEFERMLSVTSKVVGEEAAASWQYLLRGAVESGFRLDELMNLSWDDPNSIMPVWEDGEVPQLSIPHERQKNDVEESIPLVPGLEFLLLETPPGERTGWVFNPVTLQIRQGKKPHSRRPTSKWVGKVISRIGRKAGIIVQPAKGQTPAKFASMHDLRRTFANQLRKAGVRLDDVAVVIRHSSTETTKRYYAPANVEQTGKTIREAVKGVYLGTPPDPTRRKSSPLKEISDPDSRFFKPGAAPMPRVAMTSSPPTPPRLAMSGIRHRYGATHALSGVDLEVRSGEVHALVGENGAGKSTLMKVLSGALVPDAGTIQLDGQPYAPQSPADGRAAGVAMIYQELSLAPDLTVAENISLGVEPTRGPFVRRQALRDRAAAALQEIGRPEIPLDLPAGRLSVAEQQLVEIARSVAIGCRVLVLDEPTSTLPRHDVERLFALIRRLRERGLAIVYISHFLEEVKAICDRFTALRDGRTTGSGDVDSMPVERIVAMMVGREVEDLYPRSPRKAGDVVLSIRDLAGVTKPESATLDLRRGEVVGIAGIIGAGRTELLRSIMGLDPVASGSVRVATIEGWQTPGVRWRQGMGLVSEDRKREGLALDLSIAENITLPKLTRLTPHGWVTPAAQSRASQPLVERLAIKCRSPQQTVGALSGGNQQKVAIARLLHADVDMLLLDEPTRGIDVGSKAEICRLINELAVGDPSQGRPPKGVLIVSSYLPELLGLCDRIAVMCRGRLGAARRTEEWSEHEIMLAATGAKAELATA